MTLPEETPRPGQPVDAVRLWAETRARAEAERAAQQEAQRDAVLASDADRDHVCSLLSTAFSDGRLTSADFDERTSRALAARTHGDLDDVVAGLTGAGFAVSGPPARARTGAKVLFWVVGFFTAPFVFFGTMLLLFGSDAGDRIGGIVMLVLFLPGLLALYRRAHPKP